MALKSKDVEQVRPTVPVAAAAQGELVRINFMVPADVRKDWKRRALDSGVTLQQLIVEAMSK